MKPDELAGGIAIGFLLFVLRKQIESALRSPIVIGPAKLDPAAAESRAYELARQVIEKAKAP